jgi:hypothetical protein
MKPSRFPDETFQVERKPGRLSGKNLPGFLTSNLKGFECLLYQAFFQCPDETFQVERKPGRLSGQNKKT